MNELIASVCIGILIGGIVFFAFSYRKSQRSHRIALILLICVLSTSLLLFLALGWAVLLNPSLIDVELAKIAWGLSLTAMLLAGGGFTVVIGLIIKRTAAGAQPALLSVLIGVVTLCLAGVAAFTVKTEPSANLQEAITVPPGFGVQLLLGGPQFVNATSMAFGEDGELFIAAPDGIYTAILNGPSGIQGVRLYTDSVKAALGLAVRGRQLYASSNGNLYVLRDLDGDRKADDIRVLASGLPSFVYATHSTNGLAFGPDGRLYWAVGGTSDHGPELDPVAGSILSIGPDTGEYQVYARGLRNPYDLAWCHDGQLFATDNGPDTRDGTLVYGPPDELNLILPGRNYGYPDVFGYAPSWSDTESPIALLPAGAVPVGIACYEGQSFPAEMRGDLFIALWASGEIRRAHSEATDHGAMWKISSFVSYGPGRPIDVIAAPNGDLLWLDYLNGQIYRVFAQTP